MSNPTSFVGLPGQDDPQYQTWVMLLNGYGYNWYRLDNQLRADDLLVRSRASDHLAAAAGRLREIEASYRRKFLPPPTRERPDPDPDHLAAVRHIRAVTDWVTAVDTRVRGAAVPPSDMVWMRHRNETDTLLRLARCDVVLVGAAKALADTVAALPLEAGIEFAAERPIAEGLEKLAATLAQRADILSLMV